MEPASLEVGCSSYSLGGCSSHGSWAWKHLEDGRRATMGRVMGGGSHAQCWPHGPLELWAVALRSGCASTGGLEFCLDGLWRLLASEYLSIWEHPSASPAPPPPPATPPTCLENQTFPGLGGGVAAFASPPHVSMCGCHLPCSKAPGKPVHPPAVATSHH